MLAILALSLSLSLGLGVQSAHAASGGVPVLRDFEDLPVGPVFNQYDGATFIGGDFQGHPVTVFVPSVATASGTRALSAHIQGGEFEGTHFAMRFDLAQYRVSFSTGLASDVTGPGASTMLVQGFTADPTTASGAVLVSQVVVPCLGTGPTPITQPVEIDDNSARMLFVEISLVDCTQPSVANSGPVGAGIVLDNLLYDRPLKPPARESVPPIVSITSPTNGAVVTGATPGSISQGVLAKVQESTIYSAKAQVNGHNPVPVNYWPTGPNTWGAGVGLDGSAGLIDGVNTVVLTVVDWDSPKNTGTASVTFTFHVQPVPPPSQVDIWPTAFEVTQTIDYGPRASWSPTNEGYEAYVFGDSNIPLVAGKRTLIRIYGGASGTNTPQNNVPATMYLYRDICATDCGVPGADGYLAPVSGWTAPFPKGVPIPNPQGITVSPFGTPGSLVGSVTNLKGTWNFMLEPSWTAVGPLVVVINVNSGNYSNLPHGQPVAECGSNTAGTCGHNNEVVLRMRFVTVPSMYINYQVIHVTGTYNGQTYNDLQPTKDQINAVFAGINELYAAPVIMGDRSDITVSPAISGDDLLARVNGCSHDHETWGAACPYVPLTIALYPSDQSKPGWCQLAANDFNPSNGTCTVGRAWVGVAGAWAQADNPIDAAHELGHNIGFDHWACENGVNYGLPGTGLGGTPECAQFPIDHGGTGVFATDIGGVFSSSAPFWRVIPPGDNSSNATPHAHDFMSYGQLCSVPGNGGAPGCDLGEWVSWYDYNILLNSRDAGSYDTDDPPALLVRGRISSAGVATFKPVYQVTADHPITDRIVEDDPNDIYTIQGYDVTGNVLFVHNFEPFKIDDHNPTHGQAFAIEEAVPTMPNLARLEVHQGARTLGKLVNPAPGKAPTVRVTEPIGSTVWSAGQPGTIRWTASSPAGRPLTAFVEYSPDGGTTRIPLGTDIPGSSITINPDELPASINALIYVQVSDGMNTAMASSSPFTVKPKPPIVHIVTPQTNMQTVTMVPTALEGTAYDREEALTDAEFRWTLDNGRILGTGRQLTVAGLTVGPHVITLSVTDRNGLVGQDVVRIRAVALSELRSQPATSHTQVPPTWVIIAAVVVLVLLFGAIVWRRLS